MNIGEEEEKGNILCQAAYPLMKESKLFNFVGNVEGREMFDDNADVYCLRWLYRQCYLKTCRIILRSYPVKRNIKDDFFDMFNYEQYGGSPILGVNAPVLVGHGISSPEAIKNMVLLSKNMVESALVDKIKLAFQ